MRSHRLADAAWAEFQTIERSGGVLAAPLRIEAQPAARLFRVLGWLDESWVWGGPSSDLDAFRRRLGELGWTEGRNIAIVVRSAENKPDRLPALANELVAVYAQPKETWPAPLAALWDRYVNESTVRFEIGRAHV